VVPAVNGRAPDGWLTLTTPLPPPGREFLLVDALRRLGAHSVERQGAAVVAWLPEPPSEERLLADARAALHAVFHAAAGGPGGDVTLRVQHHSADAWQARLHEEWSREPAMRRVADGIVVTSAHASHSSNSSDSPHGEPTGVEGDVVIRLHPGVGFGTAGHATTRACLRLLTEVVRPGDDVMDIGTGSGILAIAASLLGARHVLALEADPLACEEARRNAAANGVAAAGDGASGVEVVRQRVTPESLRVLAACDVVIANIDASLISALFPAIPGALRDGGVAIVSGVTAGERQGFVDAAAAAGFRMEREMEVERWMAAVLRLSGAPADGA
jgi:ribosomal protein L11 methylase PrmA